MRNKFADTLYALAKDDPKICAIVADISPAGSMQKFREEYPERFINTGVAEQIMIGMAAGMAQRGLRPFAYTIATFALYRPFEFIRNDLCYQDLPVTVVGIGAGRLYSTLGATHHAQEDIAVATALPNLQVIAPCDPLEVEAATRWCAQESKHPTYLRLGKAGEPVLTATALEPWQFGRFRYLQRGRDCAIITYGHTMKLAQQVRERFQICGWSVSVISCHTLSSYCVEDLSTLLDYHEHILVLEETSGMLTVLEQIESFAYNSGHSYKSKPILGLRLPYTFSHRYGTHDELLRESRMTASEIMANPEIKNWVKTSPSSTPIAIASAE